MLKDSLVRTGRVIAFYPKVAQFLGDDIPSAIFLCQFAYWSDRVGDREIYKTKDEIRDETSLTVQQQRRICEKLTGLGYITIVKKSLPARNYYQINWDKVDADYEVFLNESSVQTLSPVLFDEHHQSCSNNTTTSQTTSQITTNISCDQAQVDFINSSPESLVVCEDEKKTDTKPSKQKQLPVDYDLVFTIWNEMTDGVLASVKIMTPVRKRAIQKIWKEDERHQADKFWKFMFYSLTKNDHWSGRSRIGNSEASQWAADFDWCLKNYAKVVEWGMNYRKQMKHGG